MLDEVIEFMETLEADDRLFEVMARIIKKFHNALVKEGFTDDQATRIIASQGAGILRKA